MPLRVGLGLCVLAASMSFCTFARAEGCHEPGHPFVALESRVLPPDQVIATDLERHLRAELGSRGIEVCASAQTTEQRIAHVLLVVDHATNGPFTARIEVIDAVTDKTLTRTIDLSRLTPRGRLLAVAASTDELLRASWIELSVGDAPAPKMAPPAAVLEAVRSSLAPAAPVVSPVTPAPRLEIGAGVHASSFFGLREALGGAIGGLFWIRPRAGVFANLGADSGFARSSAHGRSGVDAIFASAGPVVALLPREGRAGVDAELGLAIDGLAYRAEASASGIATSANDWALVARAGLSVWLRSPHLRWSVTIAGVEALRPSVGSDATSGKVTGVRGAGAEAAFVVRFGR